MADWTDPTTWRDAKKFDAILRDLSKRIESQQSIDPANARALMQALVAVMSGHQKSLVDISFVVGKLVAYTTDTHEERRREVDAIHDLVKSVKRLTKDVNKLTRRAEKLERKAARQH